MIKNKTVNKKVDPTWNKFINEAERQLKEVEAAEEQLKILVLRKHGLQTVIAQFKVSRDAGEPWPAPDGYTVTQEAGTAKEAIPA